MQPIVDGANGTDASADDEGDGEGAGVLTSVMYVIVVQALLPADVPDFALPPSRPVPGDFPLPVLIFEDETVLTVNWATAPGQSSYQFTLLSPEPTFDVVDEYRQILLSEGYDLLDDQAQGFQTVIDFGNEDGTVLGRLSIDEFIQDDSFTAVLLEVSISATSSN